MMMVCVFSHYPIDYGDRAFLSKSVIDYIL